MHLKIIKLIFLLLLSNSIMSNPHIAFRYDDYSNFSDFKIEKEIFKIFSENKIPLSVAVVPFSHNRRFDNSIKNNINIQHKPLDSIKIKLLKHYLDNFNFEIMLHGYNHIPYNSKSEFAGLNYIDQKKMIDYGKKQLEDDFNTNIEIFCPPFNSYDLNTVKALKSSKIFKISSSTKNFVKQTEILNSPVSSTLLEMIKDFKYINKSDTITIMFHDFNFFSESNPNGLKISDLSKFLKFLININTNFLIISDLSIDNNKLEKIYSSHFYKKLIPSRFLSYSFNKLSEKSNFISIYIYSLLIIIFSFFIFYITSFHFNLSLLVLEVILSMLFLNNIKLAFILALTLISLFTCLLIKTWKK